jgi:UDP-glucose 4-epimerase
MNILVLGGNGFIGSHVVDTLIGAGHSVRVFDRSPESWREPIDGVRYFLGDFDDRPLIGEALQGVDLVVHLISTTVPSTSNLDPVADIQSNLVRSVQLLQLMSAAGVKRIIYFSSGGTVYGVPEVLPILESAALNPICSYGVVKVAIEKYLLMFDHLYGFRSLILRPSNPYGVRQGHVGVQGAVATFMQKVLARERISIWGDGFVRRDYVEVTDIAQFCRIAIEKDATGVFNLGSGVGLSLRELIGMIEQVIGVKAQVDYQPARRFDVPEVVLDISRAKSEIGWNPQVRMLDGLHRYYDWLRSQSRDASV